MDAGDAKCVAEHCLNVLATYQNKDSCIVYAPSIELVVVVKEVFANRWISCVTYTCRQEDKENESSLNSWRQGSVIVFVATSAFGMGIDYDHVFDVILFGIPYSLEDFAQKTGRAGRDGKPSHALLMYVGNRDQRKFTFSFIYLLHYWFFYYFLVNN